MSTEPQKDVCGRCKAYNKDDSTCHYLPPTTNAGGDQLQWPRVKPTDWCRQWENDGSDLNEFWEQMIKAGGAVEGV